MLAYIFFSIQYGVYFFLLFFNAFLYLFYLDNRSCYKKIISIDLFKIKNFNEDKQE